MLKCHLLLLAIFGLLTFSYGQTSSWRTLGENKTRLYGGSPLCQSVSGDIYAGGGAVYKWDGTSWEQLGLGPNALNPNAPVMTICTDNSGNVYVAGVFTDGSSMFFGHPYVAKWDGHSWSELGSGANTIASSSPIYAICSDAVGNIYAAGSFSNFSKVVKWDGNSWNSLDSALHFVGSVEALCADDHGNIYAGSGPYVEKWDGSAWRKLGGGTNIINRIGYNGGVIQCLSVDAMGSVYAAGDLTDPNGKEYVAMWNGNTWNDVGSGNHALNANNTISSIAVDPTGNLYAGGSFTNSANQRYVARWDGIKWGELVGFSSYYSIPQSSLLADNSGNLFNGANVVDTNGFRYIDKWNIGTGWTRMGNDTWTSLGASDFLFNGVCADSLGNIFTRYGFWDGTKWNRLDSLLAAPVYIGSDRIGNIYEALQDTSGNHILKRDGNDWVQLGGVINSSAHTHAICTSANGDVFVGGLSDSTGAHLLMWNGVSWSIPGTGNNALFAKGDASSICADNSGNVYAAGGFDDTAAQGHVIKWDGSVWTALANSPGLGWIYPLCIDPAGTLYGAGTDTSGYACVGKWDGNAWSELGTGTNALRANGTIGWILADTDQVYAAGAFTDSLPGHGHPYVAKWDGTHWSMLGTGGDALNPNSTIFYICKDHVGNIYAGGAFTDSFGYHYIARYGKMTIRMNSSQSVCIGSVVTLNPIVTFGNPPYSYSWINGTGYALSCNSCANPSVTINQNSIITLLVTDLNGDTASASVSFQVNTATNQMQLGVQGSALNCSEDSVAVHIIGALPPFSVSWGDGVNETDTSLLLTHKYYTPGSYVIAIKDSISCVVSVMEIDSIQANQISPQLRHNVPAGCLGNGQLVLNAVGGTIPYSYRWSDGETTDSITNLQTGLYTLTITDMHGCVALASYYVNQQYDFYVFVSPNDANCGNTGSISAGIYGGTTPYKYLWSNADTLRSPINLSAGNYTITVTDAVGCQTTGTTIVNNNCYSVLSGIFYGDFNNNCIYDSTDIPLNGYPVDVISSNGNYYFGYTDATGKYTIIVRDTGNYTNLTDTHHYSGFLCDQIEVCDSQWNHIYVAQPGDTIKNLNFAFEISNGFDLAVDPGSDAAGGFAGQFQFSVLPYNLSPFPYNGQVTVTLIYDSNIIYLNSLPPIPIADTIAHVLTWLLNGTTLPTPNADWTNERFINNFHVPANLGLNYSMKFDLNINPKTGDCDSANNHVHFEQSPTGALDPNGKEVYPKGNITNEDSILTYTIHYQNTGTDSTHFIVIKDTLSPYLDPASVRNLSCSQPYTNFDISRQGILTWTFNPIFLVDSATNPEGSKGYISFSVKKKPNLPLGSNISNSATIYFDYNSGVLTNTVTDTVIASDTTIYTSNLEMSGENQIYVRAYPNPFSNLTHFVVTGLNQKFDFELFDITGRLQQRIPSLQTSQFDFGRQDLAPGVYLYRICVFNKALAFGKLVVQ